jgi:K+-transporting ATPase KdpF subunit
MKAFLLIILANLHAPAKEANYHAGSYFVGALLAVAILCYLVYSLIKPEKF